MCGACEDCSFKEPETKRIFNEIHITVKGVDIRRFRSAVTAFDVNIKVILIGNVRRDNTVSFDLMTSYKVEGELSDATYAMWRLANNLEYRGFDIVRRKIETVPWYDKVEITDGYFECHFSITTPHSLAYKHVSHLAWHYLGAHLSYNTEKPGVTMMTIRAYHNRYDDFLEQVEQVKSTLATAGVKHDKEIVEFAIYDDNRSHDDAWMA